MAGPSEGSRRCLLEQEQEQGQGQRRKRYLTGRRPTIPPRRRRLKGKNHGTNRSWSAGKDGQNRRRQNEDIRGYRVRTASGEEIGEVEELLVDAAEEKVRFLIVASGGFLGIGKGKAFIPVDAIRGINEGDTEVLIGPSRDQVAGAPEYDPDLAEAKSYYEGVYGIYGFSPYWSPDYSYPGYPYYPRRSVPDQTLWRATGNG
jgi:sporulation protein YlmC with PRC-barrel domain